MLEVVALQKQAFRCARREIRRRPPFRPKNAGNLAFVERQCCALQCDIDSGPIPVLSSVHCSLEFHLPQKHSPQADGAGVGRKSLAAFVFAGLNIESSTQTWGVKEGIVVGWSVGRDN